MREVTEGKLILDVIDARSRQLVWRGTATATLDGDASTREREARLDDAVRKMLKTFPPRRT